MTRTGLTAVQIAGTIVFMLVLSLIAYEVGAMLGKSFLSADSGITHAQWKAHFLKLVCTTGGLTTFFSLLWYFMARFGLKIAYAFDAGKRTVWAVLGALSLVSSFALPYVYSSTDHVLKMGMSVPLLFVVLFSVIGYWGGSIVSTPAAYKYTPIGAYFLRKRK